MLHQNNTDEGAAASSFVTIRKAYQTRMKPFMINVRRSSLSGNAIPFNQTGRTTSGFVISASGETRPPIEDKVDNLSEREEQSAASFDAVALNQGASPATSKSSKRSILTRLLKRKRSGSSKSTSTLNNRSVASSPEGSAAIEISVIQSMEERESESENQRKNKSSKEKDKRKVKFPKVSLYFRRLRNVVGRKNVGANPFNDDDKCQAMELLDRIDADGTPLEMTENQQLLPTNLRSIRMNGEDAFTVSQKSIEEETGATEINNGVRNGEIFVTIIPEISHENRLARKCKAYGEAGLIERCINLQYYAGLSPFRFDKKGKIVSKWLSKASYLTTNSIAFIFNIGQIRVVYEQKIAAKFVDPIYFYILMGCQSAFAILQARHFQLMWFNPNQVRRVIMADRRCPFTNSKWNKIIALAFRLCSTITSLLCALAGFGIIHNLADWSWERLLEMSEDTIYSGFLQDAVRLQNSLSASSNSSIIVNGGNNTFVTNGTFSTIFENTTQALNTTSTPQYLSVGWFIDDGHLETQIIGCVGIFMNFCYRMVIACAQELMFASNWSLWNGMRKLKFETIMSSHRESKKKSNTDNSGDRVTSDDDSVSGWLVDTEDEEYDEKEKLVVCNKVEGNETMRRVANKTNDVFKLFWPWLALAALITTAVILFCCGEGRWYTALGLILFIYPTYISFYFGIKLALQADDISVWYSSKRAQSVIKASCKTFGMNVRQMILQPFGFGTGLFYISAGFLAGFFGAAVSYFFSQSQAAHGQESIANCTVAPA